MTQSPMTSPTVLPGSADRILEELVLQRRKEVESLQRRQAEQLKDLEARGQSQLRALKEQMGEANIQMFEKIEHAAVKEAESASHQIKEIKARLAATRLPTEAPRENPILDYGRVLPRTAWSLTPYYATLHGSDGNVYWQGYNPGNFTLFDTASGAGSGIFGTGAASFTVYLDWWFAFQPNDSRFFNYTVYVPYHGFYIVYADDGFFSSKEAAIRMDLCTQGYQYNWKAQSCTNVLAIDSQNINVNDRFDGWRTIYYSDLLGGTDTAYLLVSASFYVYARGGGSFVELNFADGSANYIGVPVVYVS